MKRLISAALVAAAMGLALCGCEDKSSPSAGKTTTEKAVDTAAQQAQKAADATKEAASKAADAAKATADAAKQAASDAAAKVQQPAPSTTTAPPAAAPKTGTTAPSPAPSSTPATGTSSGSSEVPAAATTAMKDYLSSLTGLTQRVSTINSPVDGTAALTDLKSMTGKVQDAWAKLDSLAPGVKDQLKSTFATQLKPATAAFDAQVQRLSGMEGMGPVADLLKGVKLFK